MTKPLPIVWQRLVKDGKTCDRCNATHGEIECAVDTLREVLRPLDIEPVLETREVSDSDFRVDPSLSNRIAIGGRPIEDWLNANVGKSRCCSVCGDADCRTVEVDGNTFAEIPERLVLSAGLAAAAQMLRDA